MACYGQAEGKEAGLEAAGLAVDSTAAMAAAPAYPGAQPVQVDSIAHGLSAIAHLAETPRHVASHPQTQRPRFQGTGPLRSFVPSVWLSDCVVPNSKSRVNKYVQVQFNGFFELNQMVFRTHVTPCLTYSPLTYSLMSWWRG